MAIIAVITVPIILNVIDESKKGAVKDSAYGYKNAIESYYATEIMNEPELKINGTYLVENDGTMQGMDIEKKIYGKGIST